jgi:hypothetical protein
MMYMPDRHTMQHDEKSKSLGKIFLLTSVDSSTRPSPIANFGHEQIVGPFEIERHKAQMEWEDHSPNIEACAQ